MSPPEKPDVKKNSIIESGKNLPEGQPKEEQLKYYKVLCPKCRVMPGYQCTDKRGAVDVWSIHISRVLLYEAYALGTVNEFGIGINGLIHKGSSE